MGIVLEIQKIPPEGMGLAGALDAHGLSLECAGIAPAGPLEYDLRLELAGRELIARGSLELPLELVCSRCLKTYGERLRVPRYFFTRTVHEREIIDLTESVREDIIIALPLKPLCRAECRGCAPDAAETAIWSRVPVRPRAGTRGGTPLRGLNLPRRKTDDDAEAQTVQEPHEEAQVPPRTGGFEPRDLPAMFPTQTHPPGLSRLRLLQGQAGDDDQGKVNA